MTWQPEVSPARRRPLLAAYVALLAASLAGLAVSAVGIAHQVLPRQFTVAQQGRIISWEWQRKWRALPAGKIFPATVPYQLPSTAVDADQGLALDATRLGISTSTSCASALPASTARIIGRYGCAAVLRATYVDSTGSLVATIAVAVLPDSAKAKAAATQLTSNSRPTTLALVRPLPVARTEAAGFGDRQRQVSSGFNAGPYLIMTTAGFADGRPRGRFSVDYYVDQEMASLASGLSTSARAALGRLPARPTCPGAPGC